MGTRQIRRHGELRGLSATDASPNFEGKFGRMFRTLPKAAFSDDALQVLAQAMVAEHEEHQTPETDNPGDDEESSIISAGYTYLGQFIDHDITFDPASSLQKEDDPAATVDFRTPRFDLDCLYGRGPDDQPYLYDENGRKFLLGRKISGSDFDPDTRDLQRNNPEADAKQKRAIIGDPRNDENVIVSQLQGIFLRFHNRLADEFPDEDFSTIQRMVRWHYQWVVLHDFLPTIIGEAMVQSIFPNLAKGTSILVDAPVFKCYKWKNNPFMPVEFSVAAYRFGHSMIRPIYRLNQHEERVLIFDRDPKPTLTGFREYPENFAIDWRLFFDFGNNPNKHSKHRIQPAYKIDSSLVNPLGALPPSIAVHPSSLALRNLMRGNMMGLPSGQDVARKLGLPVIADADLKVGKAIEDGQAGGKSPNPTLVSLHHSFAGKAPLWYYILAEAQQAFKDNNTPVQLGPVGGRIVGETFAGLLVGDKHSYLNQDPLWTPLARFSKNGKFGIVELISTAIGK